MISNDMDIPLKTQLHVSYRRHEDKNRAEILAKLVERKLKERKYEKMINDILVQAGEECLNELKT
jgi:hypothetical protein